MTMKTPDEWADEACNEMEADSKHIAECVAEAVEQAQKSDAAEIARLRAVLRCSLTDGSLVAMRWEPE